MDSANSLIIILNYWSYPEKGSIKFVQLEFTQSIPKVLSVVSIFYNLSEASVS